MQELEMRAINLKSRSCDNAGAVKPLDGEALIWVYVV